MRRGVAGKEVAGGARTNVVEVLLRFHLVRSGATTSPLCRYEVGYVYSNDADASSTLPLMFGYVPEVTRIALVVLPRFFGLSGRPLSPSLKARGRRGEYAASQELQCVRPQGVEVDRLHSGASVRVGAGVEARKPRWISGGCAPSYPRPEAVVFTPHAIFLEVGTP